MVESPSTMLRGFHLDLRIQLMTPDALHRLAKDLADLGYNALVMEWEGSYPYRRHATISHAKAYTPSEVKAFMGRCHELGLTVIPLQQTLGHMEHILRHRRYRRLSEDLRNRCQLCPRKIEECRELIRGLLRDMREFHTGPWIHLGGDEAYLLGHCPECSRYGKRHGMAKLYTEYYRMVVEEAKRLGWKPVLWADMLLKHPEALNILPKDTVLIDWNYGWKPDRFGDPKTLIAAGFTVWGAAALRSSPDNHSLTWWARHLGNLRDFIPFSRKMGYSGFILTSWSTSGVYGYHWDEDVGGEVLSLLPVRRVYPLSGHRLLIAACSVALESVELLSPGDFLKRYAKTRFSLGDRAAMKFARALMSQGPRYRSRPSAARLAALRPRLHIAEFQHLRLIQELHAWHGAVLRLQERFQAIRYRRERAGDLLVVARRLAHVSSRLERDYARLQRGYLVAGERELDARYRTARFSEILKSLENQVAE